MKNTKIRYDRFYFFNRWKQRKYSRPCDWTIIGISIGWSNPNDFCYRLSFFGFELIFWFIREFINDTSKAG